MVEVSVKFFKHARGNEFEYQLLVHFWFQFIPF
ncbi:hypothetical protein AsAng_0051790 [Aureispira anguillae]|uniref:Uncharacterized protein n=1 Tax=Aureispira anguillae TaxID=2864201 RepID=A0A915YJL7_9BACT|nr:hypothetical protein AsAng_0051790 [Aureispira anguillae]